MQSPPNRSLDDTAVGAGKLAAPGTAFGFDDFEHAKTPILPAGIGISGPIFTDNRCHYNRRTQVLQHTEGSGPVIQAGPLDKFNDMGAHLPGLCPIPVRHHHFAGFGKSNLAI